MNSGTQDPGICKEKLSSNWKPTWRGCEFQIGLSSIQATATMECLLVGVKGGKGVGRRHDWAQMWPEGPMNLIIIVAEMPGLRGRQGRWWWGW